MFSIDWKKARGEAGNPVRVLCSDKEMMRYYGYIFQVELAVFAVGLNSGVRERKSWLTPGF